MATYYVDQNHQNASDDNPGTNTLPWKTISRAVADDAELPPGAVKPQSGDTVYVKEGTYREKVKVKRSGDNGNYITLAAYPEHKHKVIISGAEVLHTDWESFSYQSGVYRADGWKYELSTEDAQILQESKEKILGIWLGPDPNNPYPWKPGLPGTLLGMRIFPDIKTATDVVAQWLEQDLNEKQVFVDGIIQLDQVFSLTDMAMAKGRFFVDPATHELYVRLKDDSNPANHIIEAAKITYLFIARNVHHVKVHGLVMHKAASLLLMHTEQHGNLHAVLLENCHNMILEENRIEWMSASGLVVDSGEGHTLLMNNKVNNNGHIGIALVITENVHLEGNETTRNGWRWEHIFSQQKYENVAAWSNGGIHGSNTKGTMVLRHRAVGNIGHGLWFDTGSGCHKILDGDFSENKGPGRAGIRLEGSGCAEVARNRLFKNEGGGISISGSEDYPADNCWVHHNVINNNGQWGTGVGVLGAVNGNKIYNNTIVDHYIGIAGHTTGINTEIKNNIIACCRYEGISFTQDPSQTILTNNDFWENLKRDVVWHQLNTPEIVWVYISSPPPYLAWESNIKADPMFIDKAGGNFRLKWTPSPFIKSPCIDAGVYIGLPFIGSSPDIGAYEFEEAYRMPAQEIKKYDVAYYGGGKNTTGYQYRAIIGLRRDDNSLIGGAYFHRDPATMPNTDNQTSSGYVWCHYLWEDFPRVLDLLRNEKPVFVRYVDGGWSIASITTSIEPVGEGEQP